MFSLIVKLMACNSVFSELVPAGDGLWWSCPLGWHWDHLQRAGKSYPSQCPCSGRAVDYSPFQTGVGVCNSIQKLLCLSEWLEGGVIWKTGTCDADMSWHKCQAALPLRDIDRILGICSFLAERPNNLLQSLDLFIIWAFTNYMSFNILNRATKNQS